MHACSRDTEGSILACHNYRFGWLLMLQLNGGWEVAADTVRYCSRDPAFTPPFFHPNNSSSRPFHRYKDHGTPSQYMNYWKMGFSTMESWDGKLS
jgi:hypothetical protein